MKKSEAIRGVGLRSCLKACLRWLLAAALLLPLSALLIANSELSSESLGYISSALSFLCALCASSALPKELPLFSALLLGLLLCILLLSLGVLIGAQAPEPSALLSVVSFTLAGTLCGALLRPSRSGRKKFRVRH